MVTEAHFPHRVRKQAGDPRLLLLQQEFPYCPAFHEYAAAWLPVAADEDWSASVRVCQYYTHRQMYRARENSVIVSGFDVTLHTRHADWS